MFVVQPINESIAIGCSNLPERRDQWVRVSKQDPVDNPGAGKAEGSRRAAREGLNEKLHSVDLLRRSRRCDEDSDRVR
jgi:hypothetical protein